MESHLSIDEVARRTGLSAHTLRYYERIGLIAPVARAPGGQRRYAAVDLEWIGFLLRLRATRMPIGQMQAFARLRSEGNATAGARRALLEAHLAEVLATIEAMQQAATALQAKIGHYRDIERSLPSSTTDERESHATGPLRNRPRAAARDRR
ncbi:MerR family transcriptional regulator [Azoarcus olearius]|uniref:MerR family transcriptional regulator n=1 Tax=Azoarcus sp. (strain BH72) TaxID=418699 RepID=UPI00080608D5|nr:MerR family transcriptional regulator [Azoarcus olearius]ANQ87118.1 MerR family transcriptional regulator [Azoarcus olearius]